MVWCPLPVRREDLDAVCAMARETFAMAWERASLEEELARDYAWCRILRRDGIVAAFSNFWIVGDELQLHHLATASPYRRLGCATALLGDMLAIGLHAGAQRAYLEVRRSNDAALRLYRRHGFRGIGVRLRYYADNNEDAIVMLREGLGEEAPLPGDLAAGGP
jgi:ribosomal-protein-alanine N-acetyltransferase